MIRAFGSHIKPIMERSGSVEVDARPRHDTIVRTPSAERHARAAALGSAPDACTVESTWQVSTGKVRAAACLAHPPVLPHTTLAG